MCLEDEDDEDQISWHEGPSSPITPWETTFDIGKNTNVLKTPLSPRSCLLNLSKPYQQSLTKRIRCKSARRVRPKSSRALLRKIPASAKPFRK